MKLCKFLIFVLIVSVAALLSLTSCVSTQTLSFGYGLSGNASYRAEIKDYFITVLDDFTTFQDSTGEEQMVKSMNNFNHNLVVSQYASGEKQTKNGNTYEGTFLFTDFAKLFDDLAEGKTQSVLSLSSDGVSAVLKIHIDRENYEELDALIPFITDETLSGYGPKYNQDMNEDEYKEMIDFVMGDGGSGAIDSSEIVLNIVTPDGRKHRYAFPLIDFLLLHKPIDFSVSWKTVCVL